MGYPGTPIGSIAPIASAELEGGGNDEDSPASETRPLEAARPCTLRVFMCLRPADAAQQAWLTVTDEAGGTLFEGWLPVEDGVDIELPCTAPVRLHLETERCHRQANVTLSEGLNEHVFV